jgi:hypothetical protein
MHNKAYVEKTLAEDDEYKSIMGWGGQHSPPNPPAKAALPRRRLALPRVDPRAIAGGLAEMARNPSPEVALGTLAASVALAAAVWVWALS